MLPILYKSLIQNRRKFGVEFEVGNDFSQSVLKDIVTSNSTHEVLSSDWAKSINNEYWHVKTDSTCGPKGKPFDIGFEVASYVASGPVDVIDIATMADTLHRNGLKTNNNCGFHVHVDISDFDEESAGVLVARWLKIEHWMRQMVPSHRKTNKYCKFISPAKMKKHKIYYNDLLKERFGKRNWKYYSNQDDTSKRFWNYFKPNNLSPYENTQRKVAFNLVNMASWLNSKKYNKHNDLIYFFKSLGISYSHDPFLNNSNPSPPPAIRSTVEFRFAEGTLDKNNVVNWIRLFVSFVEKSKNSSLPDTIDQEQSFDQFLCNFDLQSNSEFYFLDEDLYNLKMWIMDRIINFGSKKYVEQVVKKYQIYSCKE